MVRVDAVSSSAWGRVADDGTVFVKTSDGERSVGQVPDVSAEEALEFFTKRYTELEVEVGLLEQRVRAGKMAPEDATSTVRTVRTKVIEANAVGDLQGLVGRLDGLGLVIAAQRTARKEERARQQVESREAKEKLVADAERIAASDDWRHGVHRLRELLDLWKSLPRIDRATDDELWHRFSSARTSYTRRRKAHFAELDEKREGARIVKMRLAKQAEGLASSTDWGPTAGAFRDLMRQWKAAGPAPRDVEDELWGRFRGAQDTFFAARDAANAALDQEFAANAEVKRALLAEAEALLPVQDLDETKRLFRDVADRWDAAGKVPRDQMKELESRIRAVEQTIRKLDDEQWRKSDPEKSARADDMVSKFEAAIARLEADLDKARAAGDDRKARGLAESIDSQRAFLDMARRAADDYSA